MYSTTHSFHAFVESRDFFWFNRLPVAGSWKQQRYLRAKRERHHRCSRITVFPDLVSHSGSRFPPTLGGVICKGFSVVKRYRGKEDTKRVRERHREKTHFICQIHVPHSTLLLSEPAQGVCSLWRGAAAAAFWGADSFLPVCRARAGRESRDRGET